MKNKKIISVIIPSYGSTDKLKRSINSVLNQSYAKQIELIIVDDNGQNSIDQLKTQKLIEKTNFENILSYKYIIHSKNKERSAARNTGILNSIGDYICFLDNDDYFNSLKIEKQLLDFSKKGDEYRVSYTAFKRIIGDKVIAKSSKNISGEVLMDALSRNLFVHAGSNLMIDRKLINEIGMFNEEISYNEDIEFLARILTKTKLSYVDYFGLTVDMGTKTIKMIDSENYFEILHNYKKTIEPLYKELTAENQQYIDMHLDLQTLKQFLIQKKTRDLCEFKRKSNISNVLFLKYIIYIGKRYLTKQSYGFHFSV